MSARAPAMLRPWVTVRTSSGHDDISLLRVYVSTDTPTDTATPVRMAVRRSRILEEPIEDGICRSVLILA